MEHPTEIETKNQPNETALMPEKKNVSTEILMLGLDNAGKTTLHYFLKDGQVKSHPRTLGYNVEELQYKNRMFKIYEIGGYKTIRVLRNFFMENKSFVIYVVDAADVNRFDEAQKDLHDIMANLDLKEANLLVVANKMDLLKELDKKVLIEKLKLNELKQKWQVYQCSAMEDGEKLWKIFDFM